MTAVVAVIPNRDGAGVLERCLAALGDAAEAVVVDDGSTDGSPERAEAAGARVIRSGGRGFAAAVNSGVAATDRPFVLVLNSDAFVDPGTVDALAAALEEEPRLGICGAGLVDGEGRRAKSHGYLLTLRRALAICLGLPGKQPPEEPGIQRVEFVPLACALARREALDDVGGLDEGYRFYFEDYDLCARLGDAGWGAAVRWDARAVHVGGGSSSAADPAGWLVQFQRSRLRYLRGRYPRGWLAFAILWAPNALAHALLWALRRNPRWARAYLRTIRTR